jgi:hypothetical protein
MKQSALEQPDTVGGAESVSLALQLFPPLILSVSRQIIALW